MAVDPAAGESAGMKDFGRRLARRHAQLRLNGRHTAERAGMNYQTFQKLLSGEVKSLPEVGQLLRLCAALSLTPHQALELDPIPGLDDDAAVPERDLLLARIRAALATLDEPGFARARRLLGELAEDGPEKPV
jgi:DNA-binding Xre family transcriptional regulator